MLDWDILLNKVFIKSVVWCQSGVPVKITLV